MTENKIGILGGSFNPVHKAHIKLAKHFLETYIAEKVVFVPCYVSPFKVDESTATAEHRVNMLKLATQGNSKFEINTYEVDNEEVSYTIDTVRHFNKLYPNKQLCLVIGGDQAENFHKWKDWKEILDTVDIFVALRKGYKIPTYDFEVYKKAVYMEMPYVEISASEIREDIEKHSEFLNNDVKEYIIENGVY
ncbi:MAG: nicotinate (nicotinamide) nucleotide adenylyltransferase [Chlorobiota bacterium]